MVVVGFSQFFVARRLAKDAGLKTDNSGRRERMPRSLALAAALRFFGPPSAGSEKGQPRWP